MLGSCVETNDSNFLESGGDSLTAVTLAQAIENQFNLSASYLVDTILHKSFNDIISCIEKYANTGQVILKKKKRESPSEEELVNIGEKKVKVESIRTLWSPCSCIDSAVMRGNQYFCVQCTGIIRSDTYTTKPHYHGNMGTEPVHASLLEEPSRSPSAQTSAELLSQKYGETVTRQADAPNSVWLSQNWSLDTGKCVDASPLIVQAR